MGFDHHLVTTVDLAALSALRSSVPERSPELPA
jgi:hypothetical protein